MPLAYPRLGDASGLEIVARLRAAAVGDGDLAGMVGFEHPAAEPVATGASVASRSRVEAVRDSVKQGLAELWVPGEVVAPGSRSQLDRRLGSLLHVHLDILPADAAHSGTWTFLTLVVFPDLAWARFPELHESRMLGGARNVLRRTWVRHEVLGELHSAPKNPLGEDELVGLFERTSLARNRRLVRALAREVLSSEEAPRSDFARVLYKRITHATGPLLLDALEDHQLAELVAAAAHGHEWPTPCGARASSPESPAAAPRAVVAPSPRVDVVAAGDVVLQFHREAVELSRRILAETAYRPQQLLAMLSEQGGVETARQVVGQSQPSSGFMALADIGRLDLAFENLVIRDEYRGLFPDQVVEAAETRLRDFDRLPPSTW